jgi:hypothetical protein
MIYSLQLIPFSLQEVDGPQSQGAKGNETGLQEREFVYWYNIHSQYHENQSVLSEDLIGHETSIQSHFDTLLGLFVMAIRLYFAMISLGIRKHIYFSQEIPENNSRMETCVWRIKAGAQGVASGVAYAEFSPKALVPTY